MAGTPTYTLLDSSGGRFAISGSNIIVAAPLDYETASFHNISIGVTGVTPRIASQQLTILVTDVDDPSINLSSTSVLENAPVGTAIGTLSVSFTSGTPAYSLVDSAGGKFSIMGTELLKIQSMLDFETAPYHDIIVAVTGVSPSPPNQTFRITVIDVPKAIILTNNTISEGIANGTVIGSLSVWEGTGTYTFTVTGDPDGLFTIDSDDLDKSGTVDYEVKTSHSVTITADNGSDPPIVQTLTIYVTDVADTTEPPAPTGITNTVTIGRGQYVTQTVARQYISPTGIYINEEL